MKWFGLQSLFRTNCIHRLFFYWQAGVICYLREQERYDLDALKLGGASAGALTATLTAANVDFYEATELALRLAKDGGVWDREEGLQGIWGPMIETWLDELLPDDVLERVNGRVSGFVVSNDLDLLVILATSLRFSLGVALATRDKDTKFREDTR